MSSRRSSRRRRGVRRSSIDDEFVDVDAFVEQDEDDDDDKQDVINGDDDHDDDYNGTSSSIREMEMQIVCFSPQPFKLPSDWWVEQRPRLSNPSVVDKYYHEPGSGKKFRSLLSVQRYLTQGTVDGPATAGRMIPQNGNKAYVEPRTGQKFRSLRAVDGYLTSENAYTATPKSVMKFGSTGKQSSPCSKSSRKAVNKRFCVAEEDQISPKNSKPYVQSMDPQKSGSPMKTNLAKNNRASMHNLCRPPEKVNWVLSGPAGFWSPFVDDSVVPESEKLKWSEAFILSTHDGVVNGHNNC